MQTTTQVYVMFSEIRGITKTMNVKIGISNNVDDRIKGVQTGNPGKIHLIAAFNAGKEAQKHEVYFHKKYKKFSTSGEWFEFNSQQFEDEILPEMCNYFNNIDIINGECEVVTNKSIEELREIVNKQIPAKTYVQQKESIYNLKKAIIICQCESEKVKYEKMIDSIQSIIDKECDIKRKSDKEKLAIKILKSKTRNAKKNLEFFAMGYLVGCAS
jgi:hypothetical protein